jgi:hypothetical protein
MSGIGKIGLANGTNSIALTDALVASASQAGLTGDRFSTATFNTNLCRAARLGADPVVLLNPSAGTLAGHTFLVENTNGVAGYRAGKGIVFDVTGAKGALSTGNFI